MRLLSCLPVILLTALPAGAAEVVVFAAASLKGPLDEVAARFQEETGNKVTISYAGSGIAARQVIAGAPADIFISANTQWMDAVQDAGITVGEPEDLLGNALVVIAHGDTGEIDIADLPDVLDGGKLAMGLVDSVPAGQYGKAALEHLGLWEELAPDVAQTDNVRAALALVATGEAPFGITYASDAKIEDNVSVAAQFPPESHPAIIYPAALLINAGEDADRAFFNWLKKPASIGIFEDYGFTSVTP